MPGSSAVNQVIEAAAELTDAISTFKYSSPLKDIHDEQLAGLNKLKNTLRVTTQLGNKGTSPKEAPAEIPQEPSSPHPITTPTPFPMVTSILHITAPSPRVIIHMDRTKIVHTIPDKFNNVTVHPRRQLRHKAALHVILIEEDPWEKAHNYTHKYNTRRSPRYTFAATMLRMRTYHDYCNHVLYPLTGTACTYRKSISGSASGQSALLWKKSLSIEFRLLVNGVGTRMPKGKIPLSLLTSIKSPEIVRSHMAT